MSSEWKCSSSPTPGAAESEDRAQPTRLVDCERRAQAAALALFEAGADILVGVGVDHAYGQSLGVGGADIREDGVAEAKAQVALVGEELFIAPGDLQIRRTPTDLQGGATTGKAGGRTNCLESE